MRVGFDVEMQKGVGGVVMWKAVATVRCSRVLVMKRRGVGGVGLGSDGVVYLRLLRTAAAAVAGNPE